ncbi:cellulase family glycosylhydrolase [Candidatus Poribacteria bacterium]|nr:cellulase family glycosylhydrolase [Candidatus Poribacteria bacterium]
MYFASIALFTPIILSFATTGNFIPKTQTSINGDKFLINGEYTYENLNPKAVGKLMNVRMVNSVFDDENPETRPENFDPDKNTQSFIDSMDQYKSRGILAFTINLQGGFPGYENAVNTAFGSDSSLKTEYMKRVSKVIKAADKRGILIILGLFYQRQDQILPDKDAVRNAAANAALWVKNKGYTNVMIEIANEYNHGGFCDYIKSEDGEVELINIVRENAPGLLVSTSGIGDCKFHEKLCEAADFILIHGNGCNPDIYRERVDVLRKYGKPVVFNEDWCFSNDPRGIPDAVEKARAAFNAGASWGIMNQKRNQQYPFVFGIGDPDGDMNAKEDYAAYETIAELLGID